MKNFPGWSDAPDSLLLVDGNCGLLSIWAILRYFGKRTTTKRLVRTSGYTKKNGVFGIGAASSLAQHGLTVSYFSDFDRNPHRFEVRLFQKVESLGILIKPAIGIASLLRQINKSQLGLVLYERPSGDAHLSPILGKMNGLLNLPLEEQRTYSARDFEKVWDKEGILRQALLVSMAGRAPAPQLRHTFPRPPLGPLR